MNSKSLLLVLIIGVFVVGGAYYMLRKPTDRDGDLDTNETLDDYENLNSEIIEFLSVFDVEELNVTQPGDLLSVEPFELDPENEELGEITS